MIDMDVLFFPTPKDFRDWLDANHDKQTEQWVGFYKKATKIPSITWPESVDQALCYGWIDGIRKSIDEKSYKIRFTPRKPKSHWSNVNIKKIEELISSGQMKEPGLAAWEKRTEENSGKASFEQDKVVLAKAYEKKLKANKKAWQYFSNATPSYRKQTTWWVMSAKKEETRLRRLSILIQSSEKDEVIPAMRWSK